MFFLGQRGLGQRSEGEENEKENERGKKEKEKRKFEVLGVLRSEVFFRAEGFRTEGRGVLLDVGCRVFVGRILGLN